MNSTSAFSIKTKLTIFSYLNSAPRGGSFRKLWIIDAMLYLHHKKIMPFQIKVVFSIFSSFFHMHTGNSTSSGSVDCVPLLCLSSFPPAHFILKPHSNQLLLCLLFCPRVYSQLPFCLFYAPQVHGQIPFYPSFFHNFPRSTIILALLPVVNDQLPLWCPFMKQCKRLSEESMFINNNFSD